MSANLKLKPRAQQDIESIWDYTLEKWGIEQAKKYIRDLRDRLIELSQSPDMGQDIEEVRKGYYRFLIMSHVAFYKKQQRGIEVVRILHQSMDTALHL